MALTFLDALSRLSIAGAFPFDLDTDGRKAVINEVCQRLIDSGRWKGTQQVISVTVDNAGLLTLPRQFASCQAVKVDSVARDLASKWFSFLPGMGALLVDTDLFTSAVQDQGSGFCVFADPTEPVRLQISCADDSAGTVRVQGTDADGLTIYATADGSNGSDLTVNDASPSTQYFASITGIVLPVTSAAKVLTAIYDDTTEVEIGIYEPGETVADYKRYLVPDATVKTDDETTTVQALVQRQFVEAVADTDILFTGNLGALKAGCLAIRAENVGEEGRYNEMMMRSLDMLNKELRRTRPDQELGTVRINCSGGMGMGLRAIM